MAFLSAGLLALFAIAMTLSFGIKEPLDYSVCSASAAAVLLGLSAEGARSARGWRGLAQAALTPHKKI